MISKASGSHNGQSPTQPPPSATAAAVGDEGGGGEREEGTPATPIPATPQAAPSGRHDGRREMGEVEKGGGGGGGGGATTDLRGGRGCD
ncbi:unnamed protein product [Closterium sp. NIES-64]|nr:unnamed protein product [Closterium sp. NIES-64]